jgi:rubrerythrin
MKGVSPLHRTLEQELFALLRGASLECPVCGEFVLHDGPSVRCPECDMTLHGRSESKSVQVELNLQAG